eukprot:2344002-Pyramimonas_sp.AAC.1
MFHVKNCVLFPTSCAACSTASYLISHVRSGQHETRRLVHQSGLHRHVQIRCDSVAPRGARRHHQTLNIRPMRISQNRTLSFLKVHRMVSRLYTGRDFPNLLYMEVTPPHETKNSRSCASVTVRNPVTYTCLGGTGAAYTHTSPIIAVCEFPRDKGADIRRASRSLVQFWRFNVNRVNKALKMTPYLRGFRLL